MIMGLPPVGMTEGGEGSCRGGPEESRNAMGLIRTRIRGLYRSARSGWEESKEHEFF